MSAASLPSQRRSTRNAPACVQKENLRAGPAAAYWEVAAYIRTSYAGSFQWSLLYRILCQTLQLFAAPVVEFADQAQVAAGNSARHRTDTLRLLTAIARHQASRYLTPPRSAPPDALHPGHSPRRCDRSRWSCSRLAELAPPEREKTRSFP